LWVAQLSTMAWTGLVLWGSRRLGDVQETDELLALVPLHAAVDHRVV
jgi:hypothetical protein